MQHDVVGAIDQVVDRINRIEIMRVQVEDLRKANGANKTLDAALAACRRHLADPDTVSTSFLTAQVWGRSPPGPADPGGGGPGGRGA